jgi:hypothetical protein
MCGSCPLLFFFLGLFFFKVEFYPPIYLLNSDPQFWVSSKVDCLYKQLLTRHETVDKGQTGGQTRYDSAVNRDETGGETRYDFTVDGGRNRAWLYSG